MNIKDAAVLKSIKLGQTTLLQAIAATVQKLTLEQKAAMDETTYSDVYKSGNNYVIMGNAGSDLTEVQTQSATYVIVKSFTLTEDCTLVQFDHKGESDGNVLTGYTINSALAADVVELQQNYALSTYATFTKTLVASNGDVVRIWQHGLTHVDVDITWIRNVYLKAFTSGTSGYITSAAIAKDTNIGLRYWGDTIANLVAGAAGSTIAAKICDSAGTPLHSNFVTIASSEYARIPLERPVVLTASSGGQTVWDFTSLSNADAFINELGVLAKALIVELALDGTNYTVLKEVTDFSEDISDILAPRITLVSGMGVVSGTSKLRATYIVNIPLSNTTIKLQVQLNRLAAGDTSPSIQPLVGDATKYVSAGQVAII